MGFFVFLISTFFCAGMLRGSAGGLVFGMVFYLLYRQSKKIGELEKSLGLTEKNDSPSENKFHPNPIEYKDTSYKEPPPAYPPEGTINHRASNPFQTNRSVPKKINTPKPSETSVLKEIARSRIAEFLFQGNIIARVGALILFFGVTFALKFAAEEGFFTPELRIFAATALSTAMLVFGWKLRSREGSIGTILQGTGLGVFYITVFLSFKLYHFLPASIAFLLLLSITVLSGALAVLINKRSIAALAVLGGFLAPVLASSGNSNHIGLFSYIAVLNLGIFGISWYRSWRSLNLLGLFFTILLSTAWSVKYYNPEYYLVCQLFLVFFATLYTFINIFQTVRNVEDKAIIVDPILTFITPLVFSIFQWNMVRKFDYGSAISCVAFGGFHVFLARALFRLVGQRTRFIVESYLTVGIVLLSLAVPFVFSNRVSSGIWALEATALIWTGIRQKQVLLRCLGIILLPVSNFFFLLSYQKFYTEMAFLNPFFIGVVLLTIGHFLSFMLLYKSPEEATTKIEKQLSFVALWIAGAWWFFGSCIEIERNLTKWQASSTEIFGAFSTVYPSSFNVSIFSIFFSLSTIGIWKIFWKLELPARDLIQQINAYLHVYLLLHFALGELQSSPINVAPFLGVYGIVSWPLFLIVFYFFLYQEEIVIKSNKTKKTMHSIGFLSAIIITTWQSWWIGKNFAPASWKEAALIIVPSLWVYCVSSKVKLAKLWPFNSNREFYCKLLILPVCWSAVFGILSNFDSSETSPLPYIPIVNPLDISLLSLIAAHFFWRDLRENLGLSKKENRPNSYVPIFLCVFMWSTTTLLRIMHHYFDVPWRLNSMLSSNLVQATLSIYWSVIAVSLMLYGYRKKWRLIWKTGAIIVAIVVIKLFLIDLSNHGTLGRVAAFLAVGLLLLGIGYLAPIPSEREIDKNE